MGYKILDYSEVSEGQIFPGSHITLFCTFLKNKAPVDITEPTFELYDNNNNLVEDLYLLKPLDRAPVGQIGRYMVTFLSNGLSAQKYSCKFKGKYNTKDLLIEGGFELKDVPRVQWFIEGLRTALLDKYNIQVPWRAFTFDPKEVRWSDGELWDFLNMAIQDINNDSPTTPGMFTLQNIPNTVLPIIGGAYYACIARSSVEVENFFDYSAGMVRVNIYRGEKYQALARAFREQYVDPRKEWKVSYNWLSLTSKTLLLQRVPFRILRPVSMVLYFQQTFGF